MDARGVIIGLAMFTAPVTGLRAQSYDNPEDALGARSDFRAGLFQVILNVQNMDHQVRFYSDVIGLRVIYPSGLDGYSDEAFVRFDTGGAYLALHAGRSSETSVDEPRLSFMTSDLEAARASLIENGIAASSPRSPAPGVLVVDARDPEGNAIHPEFHGDIKK